MSRGIWSVNAGKVEKKITGTHTVENIPKRQRISAEGCKPVASNKIYPQPQGLSEP